MEKSIIREAGGTAGENGDLDTRKGESFKKQEGININRCHSQNLQPGSQWQEVGGKKKKNIPLILVLEIPEDKQSLYRMVGKKENIQQ